jgi:SAM-dependent methyltransferase
VDRQSRFSEHHWDAVYRSKDPDNVSWYQEVPATSVRLITALAATGSVLDVGAGPSTLADELVERGFIVTVLDVAPSAIAAVRQRLGDRATYLVTDLLDWAPLETYDIWHDRAVFHFLTDPATQAAYVGLAAAAVRPGGAVVLATFAPDGPAACSGLPTARHDVESLAALFADHFTLASSERVEHTTPWGMIQPFTWVTLRREPARPTDQPLGTRALPGGRAHDPVAHDALREGRAGREAEVAEPLHLAQPETADRRLGSIEIGVVLALGDRAVRPASHEREGRDAVVVHAAVRHVPDPVGAGAATG